MRHALPRPARAGRAVALLGFAAAAVAGGSGTASAAPPIGIGTLSREMSPQISRCVIRRESALVDRWLRTLPGSPEEDRLVRSAEAGFTACFDRWGHRQGGWIPQYDRAGMRAALIRALLQARRRNLPGVPPPGDDSLWYSGLQGAAGAGNQASIVAADLGACLARKHWPNVLAIIKAVDPKTENLDFAVTWRLESARKREEAAVNAELTKMIPSIAGCVPAGAKLRIERPRLRSLVEEAAYHMTNGDRPAAGEGAAFNARSAGGSFIGSAPKRRLPMRPLALIALALAAAPAVAQEQPEPVARALAEIGAHRIGMRVGCSIPVPALWNAPLWEQRAAADRRAGFEDCLAGVMRREQDRLGQLQGRIADLRAQAPEADWSAAERALDSKWAELETLTSKLRARDNMANTAVRVLDTFTGPGAPFDTSPRPYYNRCAPYRCDSSTFAPGIR